MVGPDEEKTERLIRCRANDACVLSDGRVISRGETVLTTREEITRQDGALVPIGGRAPNDRNYGSGVTR